MKGKLILIGAIAVIALGVFAFTQKDKASETVAAVEDTKAEQVAAAQARLDSIKDKESVEYKTAKTDYCNLAARPEADRQQAVANVREFLHAMYPTVSKEFTVNFDCGRGSFEYYTSEGWSFIVDPAGNNIVELGQGQRESATDTRPVYDYTPRYNAEEAATVAEKFIADHKAILGVDVSKMTRQYEGTKDGGDGITPGEKVNYFFTWRNKDANGKTTELVNITITRGGQIVVFDNDTYDLRKNGN
ncbi:MAG: hypothetical protein PHQ59_01900 [Candidatus Daviesbacteria bacterium]|nr:hypothetical protein [Candidatus Daviesbacteria bacterium]